VEAALAAMTLNADLGKQADAVDFDIKLAADKLALLTAFAPPELELPGARMSLTLATKGRLDHLFGTPALRQHAVAHLGRPAVTLAEEVLEAAGLDLTLDSDGNAKRQKLNFVLAEKRLTLDEDPLGDGRISARVAWDLPAHSVDVALDAEGDALPQGHLGLDAAFEPRTRALRYQVDADLGHLTALEPLLPTSLTDAHWIDLSAVRAQLHSHGQVAGLISAVDERGVPTLAPHALDKLSGEDEVRIGLTNFHYVDIAGVELTVPTAALHTHVTAVGEKRHAEVELDMARATLVARGHKLDIGDQHDQLSGDLTGSPVTGPFEVQHRFALGRFDQDWLPLYPVGGVVMTTHGRRLDDGTIMLDDFGWTNRDGGTTLHARGSMLLARAQPRPRANVLTPVGFSSVALGLELEQKLDAIKGDPARFKGGGVVAIKGRLASGDLRRYHAEANLRFQQASVAMPTAKLQIDDLDGSLPLVEDFVLQKGRSRMLPAPLANAYPQLRFSDQHAFQSKAGALRATRIRFGDLELTDLAASLRVARSQFAVDQLDAGLRNGRIAGSCLVDWRGPDSTAQLRLRMSGIEAVHGGTKERFDGNAALALDMSERNIDGRVEILRIGRHHLFDLLDEYDPHHKDPATNRVRTALGLGYPQKVHVQFDRGFASMAVQFGGLARLVSVNDVEGIPTGPLIERYLGPLFSQEKP
jgi:translocation and assembly module TamB